MAFKNTAQNHKKTAQNPKIFQIMPFLCRVKQKKLKYLIDSTKIEVFDRFKLNYLINMFYMNLVAKYLSTLFMF